MIVLEIGKVLHTLESLSLNVTANALKQEASQKGITIPFVSPQVIADLKQNFLNGDEHNFFVIWNKAAIVDHDLSFFLSIYFAFFPVFEKVQANIVKDEEVKICQTKFGKKIIDIDDEIMPESEEAQLYFALGQVPKPHLRRQFAHIFQVNWSTDLLAKCIAKMKTLLPSTTTNDSRKLERLKSEYDRLSYNTTQQQTEIRRLERDYAQVLQLALELMDLVKSALRGEPTQLSPDLLRRFSDQLSSRPATAQPRSNSARPSSALLSGYAPSPDPIFKQPYPVAAPLSQSKSGLTYDYDAIKKECLLNGRLYQNMRVKLTQFCNTYEERQNFFKEYILVDILGCTSSTGDFHKRVLRSLAPPTPLAIRQSVQRFVNTLASVFIGRKYLSLSAELVPTLINALILEDDPVSRPHLLGALQKLSLRRVLSSQMVRSHKVMPWLVENLADPDSMTEYLLEYSVALLHNLCLRSAGRWSLEKDAENVLRVLSDLLSHDNESLKSYLNGTLFSVLFIQSFKEKANQIGLKQIIDSFMRGDHAHKTQLEYIRKQIDKEPEAADQDSDDEEGDDDDEEDGDSLEADLDVDDVFPSQNIDVLQTYLIGNRANVNNRKEEMFRPRTPGARANRERTFDMLHNSQEVGESVNLDARSNTKFISAGESVDLMKIFDTGSDSPSNDKENLPRESDSVSSGRASSRPAASRDQSRLKEQDQPADGYMAAFGERPKIPRTPDLSSPPNNYPSRSMTSSKASFHQ
ncbi:unnamed protein product [Oikopleura dioica]|uniref:LisH domain-containing protein ARMC9 n=1 Tax=Oikopleura dioica TaxID=34765 RepID=E4XIG1_OIKDI|nr:unnamed protein product [Oikopleura dioica]